MSNDLISREATLNVLKERYCDCCTYYGVRCKSSLSENCLTYNVISTIGIVPAVDAEPVRHGKWVYDPNANDWGIGGYICGECHVKNNNLPSGKAANPMIFVGTKYCPNCGAKMDLEDDE